jgi:protein-tyrosine phosphatase
MNQAAVWRRTPAWARPVRATLWEIIPGLVVAAAGSDGVSFDGMRAPVLADLRTRAHDMPDVPIGCLYVACPIPDGQTIDGPAVRGLARLLAGLIQSGREVVIQCTAGLNRSGLIAARTLIELGWDPMEAIARVRTGRGHRTALGNPSFEAWLLRERTDPGELR